MIDNLYFNDSYYNDSYRSYAADQEKKIIECTSCGDDIEEGTKFINLDDQKICLCCIKQLMEVL